ncbi:HD domain-containing protein [Microvirga mediterraneensis]|uniref:5'-deoxynucleotidase n=1 Tax=Microvirga mediterraneensis TaxID=2754695 RepID=A0A838BLH9_9HYPH|nr:HD domain-containing protein [Microvirga mediterraneensis]MBA1156171.1 HD domain-containing protein [Microvirga mediterraneensis]
MTGDRILGALEFLREAERLKGTLRSGFTSTGRPESTAEHTWRLCLMALVLSDEFEGIDLLRLIKLCIVHDLGEALNGDIPAVLQTEGSDKSAQERADLEILTRALHPDKRAEILALWEEYEAASSPEAILAKGLDKLETILQHNQGRNPADFDYAFNLGYGRKQTSAHPVLAGIRAILDEETRARAEASKAV